MIKHIASILLLLFFFHAVIGQSEPAHYSGNEEIFSKTQECDLVPGTINMGYVSEFLWNEEAQVFTTNNDFKILSPSMDVKYEFPLHGVLFVHHLKNQPIAVLVGANNVSFLNLVTHDLIKSIALDGITEILKRNDDSFALCRIDKDSLFVHEFDGLDKLKVDTIVLVKEFDNGFNNDVAIQPFKPQIVYAEANNLIVQSLKNGSKLEKKFKSRITSLDFLNEGNHLMIGLKRPPGYFGNELLLCTYPGLEVVRGFSTKDRASFYSFAEDQGRLAVFGGLSLEVIDFDGNEIYKKKKSRLYFAFNGYGFQNENLIYNSLKGDLKEIVKLNLNNKRTKSLVTYNEVDVNLLGFAEKNKKVIFEKENRLFMYDLGLETYEKVEKLVMNEYQFTKDVDPYSSRICFKHHNSEGKLSICDLNSGKVQIKDYHAGNVFFTPNENILIGFSQAGIYTIDIIENRLEYKLDFTSRDKEYFIGEHIVVRRVLDHKRNRSFYLYENTVWQLDHDSFQIKESELPDDLYVVGVIDASSFYVLDETRLLRTYNIDSKEMGKIDNLPLDQATGKFIKIYGIDEGRLGSTYFLEPTQLFDFQTEMNRQFLDHRNNVKFSTDLKTMAIVSGDILSIYTRN